VLQAAMMAAPAIAARVMNELRFGCIRIASSGKVRGGLTSLRAPTGWRSRCVSASAEMVTSAWQGGHHAARG
jgi:hypothetical protein